MALIAWQPRESGESSGSAPIKNDQSGASAEADSIMDYFDLAAFTGLCMPVVRTIFLTLPSLSMLRWAPWTP